MGALHYQIAHNPRQSRQADLPPMCPIFFIPRPLPVTESVCRLLLSASL